MRRSCVLITLGLLLGSLLPGGALAQNSGAACPVIVQSALLMTEQLCAGTGRNQACYGHALVAAEPQPGAAIRFAALGDLADVAGIQRLTTHPLDPATGQWGIALLRLQANLPDTLPGQNVTVVAFGEASLAMAAGPAGAGGPQTVIVRAGTMVVNEPSLGGVPFAGPLGDTTLQALGRLGDDLWLYVQLPDGRPGWVMAMMVTSDFGTLPVVDMTGQVVEATGGAAGSAYVLTTGLGEPPCAQAPSGLLVQTPDGAANVALNFNGAEVLLGSTAYLTAQPGSATVSGELTIAVLEGQATVTALGISVLVPAGAQTRLVLAPDGLVASPPFPPEPYDYARMQNLPLSLLDRQVVPPPPGEGLTGGGTTGGGAAGGGATGGAGANLIVNGDFSAGMSGWTVEQGCQSCGMQTNIDPAFGDYLAWARDNSGASGASIWARQPLGIDMATCRDLHIAFDVRVDGHTLPNSGWWTDEHGGNGEYPAMVRLAFMPAFQGSQFDWARGFLIVHDGATSASNWIPVPANTWWHYEADVLSAPEWVDAFGNVQTNPGVLTDIYVGGSGWDFTGAIDNIVLTGTGCVVTAQR